MDFLLLYVHSENVAEPQHAPPAKPACVAEREQTVAAAQLPVGELVACVAACWGSCHAAASAELMESAC